jgi:hypothetical protein
VRLIGRIFALCRVPARLESQAPVMYVRKRCRSIAAQKRYFGAVRVDKSCGMRSRTYAGFGRIRLQVESAQLNRVHVTNYNFISRHR